jgi:hypothetical protein
MEEPSIINMEWTRTFRTFHPLLLPIEQAEAEWETEIEPMGINTNSITRKNVTNTVVCREEQYFLKTVQLILANG